ncbi:hypothetical protein FS837_012893 [Tulasnella sp. UAMH 9824]|nr:hypothetical protein FS837_012893 [Tulasnella sp. UAMH 9824]
MAERAKRNHREHAATCGKLEPVRETNPLCIPEILILVLELSGPGAKVTAARVCRRWSDIALDMLWRDLTDVVPFLKLYALLKVTKNSHMLQAEMLERINSYGARVHTLRCTVNNASICDSGAAEVYQALCEGKFGHYILTPRIPDSGLLPNLRTLEWRAEQTHPHMENTLDVVLYFLSPSLRHIYVSGIVKQRPVGVYASGLGQLFGPSIDCAPFFRKLNSMDGLRLESLELRMSEYARPLMKKHPVETFLRRHHQTLRHLRIWDSELLTHFQEELWRLSRLRSLEIATADDLQVSGFIEGLAEGAPEMESVRLLVHPWAQVRDWKRLWNALRRLRKLNKLYLEAPTVDGLEAGDVKSMKEAWSALSYLSIVRGHSHLEDHTEGLSLEFLSAVAHHFSQTLTTLSLYFGPNTRSSTHPIDPVRFEKLQLLYIQNFSRPEDPEGWAQYFAQILPHEATLKVNRRHGWDKVVDSLERARGELLFAIESIKVLKSSIILFN